jgi:microcystin-dependent protein
MPRNASGVYVRPASDVNPKVAFQVIDPVALDNEQNDMASELTSSLDRQGRAPMLAPFSMGGFRIQNVGTPVGANDAARIMDFGMYLPPGALQLFAMQTAPSGWLVCDGSAVSRATYANLFAAIGTLYGVGDGSTTFNVPDARGRFTRVWDNGAGLDPARVFGSVQADTFASHTHVQNAHNHATTESPHIHSVGPSGVTLNVSAGGVAGTQPGGGVTGGAVTGLTINNATAVNQNTGAAETAPKNIAFQLCIRT